MDLGQDELPRQSADEKVRCARTHLGSGHVHRREWRIQVRGKFEIVESDNRDLRGDRDAERTALDQRPHGENVVAADDGGRTLFERAQVAQSFDLEQTHPGQMIRQCLKTTDAALSSPTDKVRARSACYVS